MLRSLLVILFTINLCFAFPLTPNKEITYGTLCSKSDPDFKELRYPEQIPYCNRNVDYNTKIKVYESYNIPLKEKDQYTIDHLIPLALGGSNSIHNLWPEHKSLRDGRVDSNGVKYEYFYYEQMKNGKMKQEEAISKLLKNKFNE
jgi:hypothetical protein